MRTLILFVTLAGGSIFASGGIAGTAECTSVGSRVFGQLGEFDAHKRVDELEEGSNTPYQIRWTDDLSSGAVVVGGEFRYQATSVRRTSDLITFFTQDPENTWMYSVHLKAARAVVTHHMTDMFQGDGGLVVLTSLLECQISD